MTIVVNGFFPGELKSDANVGGCIDIFENAWPNPTETIHMAEKECANPDSGVFWERAPTIGNGVFQSQRTNKLLAVTHLANLSNNAALQAIHNQFNMLLLASTIPYAQKYGIKEPLWHEGYSLLKYSQTEEYKAHYDGSTGIGRALSCIVYLNDDYEGGELEFVHFGIKIKPKTGMLVIFPSNYAYMHASHPVTKGTKYALVTWIKDREI
jgi:predicted 2-oxoglutarate/Fe(II)-dependent dioxygenase YbiX